MAKSRKKHKIPESPPPKKIASPKIGPGGKKIGWFIIIPAAVGIGICLYLYSLHAAMLLGEIKSGPLCGADGGLGCQSVASGPYSSMLGLPLASWGAVFYSALAVLGFGGVIFWRDSGRVFLRWAFCLAVLGFAFDLYLAYTMVFRIGAVCWLCVTTYVINFFIILMLLKSVRQEPKPRVPLRSIFPGTKDAQGIDLYYRNAIKGLLLGGILLTAVVGVAGSQFISKSLTGDDRVRLEKLKAQLAKQKIMAVNADNRPVMDIASDIGLDLSAFKNCLNSGRGLKVVREDIEAAIQAGVKSTPTSFINGRGLRGVPKPGMLNEILQYSKKNLAPPPG